MAINLNNLLLQIVVSVIVVSPSLWLAGRAIVGGKKAKFTDAIIIVVAGVIVGGIFNYFFTGLLAALIQLLIWLGLVKHFFDASWGQSIAIAVIAVIIFIVASLLLGLLIGVAVFSLIR